jgi:hypothetical protein
MTPPQDRRQWRGFDPEDPECLAKRDALAAIMDGFGMWGACRLRPCRRARRCAHPRVACFFAHHDTLRETVLTDLRRAIEARVQEVEPEDGAQVDATS